MPRPGENASTKSGGQRLPVQPEYDPVITLYAGNYIKPDAWQLPVKVIDEFPAAALKETSGR